VVANKLYPKAGIKIKSGPFVANGNCTAIGKGYCNLQANNVADQIFTAGSPGDNNDLVENRTELAHSVNDITNTSLSGEARKVKVTNTGVVQATGLTLVEPTLAIANPPDITTTCGPTLDPGNTCTITVTPNLAGTSSLGENGQPCSTGQAPVPWEVAINSDNSDAIKFDFSVLTYGCIYQGGYIFSIDDTDGDAAKIGGKVFSLDNQVAAPGGTTRGPGAAWGPNAPPVSGINDDDDGTGGTCDGKNDGLCNTARIIQVLHVENNIPLNQLAAGRCKATIAGFDNWYLPAICEMGPKSTGNRDPNCATAPVLQNIVDNLSKDPGAVIVLNNGWWSSTQEPAPILEEKHAFYEWINTGSGQQSIDEKKFPHNGVRCVRQLTQ
jgi:hypothetical protein